jgi:uncharacterized membrane protein YqjE
MNVDRPISSVLHDIAGNVQHIVRAEMRLAKTELREELGKSRSAAAMLAAGAFMLALSVLFVMVAIVYALSETLEPWAAAAIVAAGLGLIAAVCVGIGIKRFKSVNAVPKTTASLKENVEWARQLTKS